MDLMANLATGDVYSNWLRLLKLLRITDENEGMRGEGMKQMIKANIFLASFYLFSCLRMGFSGLIPGLDDRVFGHTLVAFGNTAPLIEVFTGITVGQAALYRLLCIRLTLSGDMNILRIIDRLRREPDQGIRDRKVRMACLTHASAVAMTINCFVTALVTLTGLMYINVTSATSSSDIAWWLFWWTQDILLVIACCMTVIAFPLIWLLVALNYRLDLMYMQQRISEVSQCRPHDGQARVDSNWWPLFDGIMHQLQQLRRSANDLNRTASPILFLLNICTTPMTTTALFVCLFMDSLILKIGLTMAVSVVIMSSLALQSVAGNITSTSERIHQELACLASRLPQSGKLRQRVRLLLVLEDLSGLQQPLALYTPTGEQCTSLSFAVYLMETLVQFSLLISFSGYLNLRVYQ